VKSWLAKYRISASLDARRPLPPSLRRQIETRPDLSRFSACLARLDRALACRPANPGPSPFLHRSIMRAVEAAGPAPAPPRLRPALRWLPAPALAVLVLSAIWLWRDRSPQPQPIESAAAVLAMGESVAQSAPSTVVAPLSDEWRRLNRDVDRTAQFLLASLP